MEKENRPLLMCFLYFDPRVTACSAGYTLIQQPFSQRYRLFENDMITIKDRQMCPECLSLSSVSHYSQLSCLFALMDQIEILPLQVTKTEPNDAQTKVTLMLCQNI